MENKVIIETSSATGVLVYTVTYNGVSKECYDYPEVEKYIKTLRAV